MLVDPWTAPDSFAEDIHRMTDDAQAAGLEVIAPALEQGYPDAFRATPAMAAAVARMMTDSEILRVWKRASDRSTREALRHWLEEARRAGLLDMVSSPDLPDRIIQKWQREQQARFVKLRDQVRRETEAELRRQRERQVGAATAAAALVSLGLPTFNGRLRGRGRVIAADQLETLAGMIAQRQQVDAGIDEFQWTARTDDWAHVRDQHKQWHDQVFTWEKGAPGVIFPGQPIRCRCRARGVVPE